MTFFVEWAPKVKVRKGHMVSLAGLGNLLKLKDPGYGSVYMFNEQDAQTIRDSGTSRGLNRFEVSAQFLVMDIDSGESSLALIEASLKEKGLSYEVWDSGSKGFHIYIPHGLVTSKHLPHSHKVTAQALAPEGTIDLTLYQHGRLLSLPGRIHSVTGRKKSFVKSVEGQALVLKIEEPPPLDPIFVMRSENPEEMLSVGLARVLDMLHYPPESGKRHVKLWGAAKDLADAGMPLETTLTLISMVNDTWQMKKPFTDLEQAVHKAYRHLKIG